MFDLDKQLSVAEVLTKRLAKLRRERATLQDLMQKDIGYDVYNALMHSIWRIDRDIKDTQEYSVRLTEVNTYDVEIVAESVAQAELFAPQKLNEDLEAGSCTVEAEVMGVVS